ncbi:DUF4157 domain-containing protein [Streptomyces sp. NBC_00827]|uniref:eCIS core domain-containing protein n=1 Tax=Streptomyces sp. NBC_00827 TaxID=2903677 RepID=UPI0038702532|nr:DUF4157 domain-containing protein [Streptomyces sp. NBC_00827]
MSHHHDLVRSMKSAAVDPPSRQALQGIGDSGEVLPRTARLERQFAGYDLSTVRVHSGGAAEQANARLHSRAYTLGEHIALGRSADPGLLAHEVAHVVQQRGGRPAVLGEAGERTAESVAADPGRPMPKAGADGSPTPRGRPPAVVQLAPNQAGTTDPAHVVGWVRGHEATAGSGAAVMLALSEAHKGNSDRYFYTGTHGWVDVRHFGKAASLAVSKGSVATEALGFANEAMQWLTEWGDDYRSGFSPEDIPSNAAGAEFGDDYIGSRTGESTADALDRWMAAHRALPAGDPGARRASLPITDPSQRGGAGRGSSNASRTRSTVSGEASRERRSVEAGARQAADPWSWIRAFGG